MKVIDASATTTSFQNHASANQASKRKTQILIPNTPGPIRIKGQSGYRVNNVRMSPLNKFIKESLPQTKQANKRNSAKKHLKTMTVNNPRGDQMLVSDFVTRATTSLSPEPLQSRPRKVLMPPMFNTECLFAAKTSKSILSRVQLNLTKLCGVDSLTSQGMELLKWTGKFQAEVMDLCRIEIVQIEGLSITEPAAPPTGSRPSLETVQAKLNLYLV